MLEDNRRYFRMKGPLVKLAKAYSKKRKKSRWRLRRFLKQFDTNEIYGSQDPYRTITGVRVPKGGPPTGWRRLGNHRRYMVANKRTPEGREIAKQLEDLAEPRPEEIIKAAGVPDWDIVGQVLVTTIIGQIGSQWFLVTPRSNEMKKWKGHKHLTELRPWQFMKLEEEKGPLLNA